MGVCYEMIKQNVADTFCDFFFRCVLADIELMGFGYGLKLFFCMVLQICVDAFFRVHGIIITEKYWKYKSINVGVPLVGTQKGLNP